MSKINKCQKECQKENGYVIRIKNENTPLRHVKQRRFHVKAKSFPQ